MAGVSTLGGIVIPIVVVRTGDKNAMKNVESDVKRLSNSLQQLTVTQNALGASQKTIITTYRDSLFGKQQIVTEIDRVKNAQTGNIEITKKQHDEYGKLNNRMNSLRWTMVNVGFVMTTLAAIAYPFVELGKFGAEMELLYTRIEVVTGNAAEANRKAIQEIRKNTEFSLQEVGNAFLEFTKQGFSAQEAMDAMPKIMQLAVVGFTDLKHAVEITSQILHVYSLDASEAARVTHVIAKAANESRADVEDFGVAMSYAAPLAAQLGIPVEDLASALALLTNAGLQASKAGTSLNAMFTQLLNPTDQVRTKMERMGLSITDSEGKIKDMNTITREWAYALDDSQESLEFLVEAMDVRGARAMNVLLGRIRDTGQGIDDFSAKLEDLTELEKNFDKIQNTTIKTFKTLKEEVVTSFEDEGTGLSRRFWLAMAAMTGKLPEEFSKWRDENTDMLKVYTMQGSGPLGQLEVMYNQYVEWLDLMRQKAEETSAELEKQDAINAHAAVTKAFRDELVARENAYNGFITTIKEGREALSRINAPSELRDLENIRSKALGIFQPYLSRFPTQEMISEFESLNAYIDEQKDEVYYLTKQIENLNVAREIQKADIEEEKEEYKSELQVLNDYKNTLSEIEDRISKISSARFKGETQVNAILKRGEIFRKQQQLATLGVADAQQFITDALKLELSEYDQLFDRISKINSEMDNNSNAFKTWQTTIQEAIRAEVQAGQELQADVTSRIKTWQTALLGIENSGTSSGSSGFDDFMNKLKLSYDVYFGGMRDEVDNFLAQQEDKENGVFDTSADLIASLKKEINSRDKYIDMIAEQAIKVNEELSEVEKAEAALAETIEDLKTKQAELASVTTNAIDYVNNKLIEFESKQQNDVVTAPPGIDRAKLASLLQDPVDVNLFGPPAIPNTTPYGPQPANTNIILESVNIEATNREEFVDYLLNLPAREHILGG